MVMKAANDIKKAASDYVRDGLPVIPLCWPTADGKCACGQGHTGKQVGKVPLIKDWSNKAARSYEEVLQLWSKKRSNANIGIPTDGLVVLDIDKDSKGFESKAVIEAKYGKLPRTRVHRTGGGGEQWIYGNPDGTDIKNAVKLGGYNGVDLRANGGQIVVPPSLHKNGNHYEVIDDSEIAPAPEWLVKMATKKNSGEKVNFETPIAEGNRDIGFTSLAGSMRAAGANEETIYDVLVLKNNRPGQNPLTDKELRKIAKSIGRKSIVKEHKEPKPLRSMADVESRALDWLWYPYLLRNKVVEWLGDPGVGKSQASQKVAIDVSMGNLDIEPADVLIATVEDDLDDTIRPRMDALNAMEDMGADLSRIHPIEEDFILNDEGLAMLDHHMEVWHPALLILDPLTHYLGSGVDLHRANEIRAVMSKLMILAREYNCCVLLIHHLNKGGGSKAIYRGLGSIDIIAAARSVCLFGYQSENDLNDKVMVHVKHNNSPRGDALTYTLDGGFMWTGKSTLTASDILETKKKSPKVEDAMEFLKDLIAEDEYMSATDVLTARDKASISPRTLTNAKKELKIESDKVEGVWYWCWKKSDSPNIISYKSKEAEGEE